MDNHEPQWWFVSRGNKGVGADHEVNSPKNYPQFSWGSIG